VLAVTIIVDIATNTHSEYVILIAFPLQQWLHKRAPILLYTYIACPVKCLVDFVEMCSVYMPVYLKSTLLISTPFSDEPETCHLFTAMLNFQWFGERSNYGLASRDWEKV